MKTIDKLSITLDFGSLQLEVGTLVLQNGIIYFRYADSFLESDFEISPFKLKKTAEIITCPKEPFDGLPGVFNDSIPDGWGRLLLDRKLQAKGIDPRQIGSLDRLSFLGNHAQGALTYRPCSDNNAYEAIPIELDILEEEAWHLQHTGTAKLLDDLYHLGGNSVGARPKIDVYYDEISNELLSRPTSTSQPWIIKFPSINDFRDSAKLEYVYAILAKKCGIEMNPTRLFASEKGRSFFGTQRFDSNNGKRLHLHSACGLLHDNFRISSIDYGHIMDSANRLENNLSACERVFRLTVFNVLALNMDDHSKNISFLMDHKGKWQLAPAYDLTYSPKQGGFQSLSVANQYKDIQRKDLLKLATHFNVPKPNECIDQQLEELSSFSTFAKEFDINPTERNLVAKALNDKRKHF
jgi:serine/threonine-protein kinase HipA